MRSSAIVSQVLLMKVDFYASRLVQSNDMYCCMVLNSSRLSHLSFCRILGHAKWCYIVAERYGSDTQFEMYIVNLIRSL
jgi:hypothetical protein